MKPMARRSILRGAGGVAISLPFLEAMLPRRQAHAATPPQRLFTFFTENGVVEHAWYPMGDETDFTLAPIMAPFEHAQLKDNLILIRGLDQYGQRGDTHRAGRAGCLTSQVYVNSGSISLAQGISLDQAVGNHVGGATRFRSLEAGVQSGMLKNAGGLFYSGPNQMIPAQDDPAKLFARVFSAGLPGSGVTADQEFTRLRARKKSIIDRALDEYKRVQAQVAPADRHRLEMHMEAIRQVEHRLTAAVPATPTKGCELPAVPAADNFPAIGKAHLDLLTMALACDLTRVVSIQWHSHDTIFRWVDATDLHHTLAHAQGANADPDAQLTRILTWFAEQAVYVIERLKSFEEVGGGNLFDRTLFYWTSEMAVGNHRLTRAPYLLANGGKLTDVTGRPLVMGRFLKFTPSLPHSTLLTSIGRIMGLPITNFGDPQWHRGPLPGLV